MVKFAVKLRNNNLLSKKNIMSDKKLIYQVNKLMKENKELTEQISKLTKNKDKLTKKIEKMENFLAALPPDLIPKGVKTKIGQKKLRFKMATIMFIDMIGFKKISEGQNTQDVIDELDQMIFEFNKIAKKYKLQKIKTIGDTYMCAGGVPVKNSTNPLDVVLATLEMSDYANTLAKEYASKGREFWDLRIGINTGVVKAQASGKKRISYDLKGETVNTATRMASSADTGRINISANTYVLVAEYFVCKMHGRLPVKYEGLIEMYHVKKLKPAYSVNRKIGLFPNDVFQVKYALRQFSDLQETILDKLEKELPEYLYYHNYKHTIDVVNQAELIGYGEGVSDEAILLLKTAALFHDAGHVVQYKNHEYYGTEMVRDMLPKYNYTQKQIDIICETIMATQLPPQPKTLLQRIICDSDLDYLGRADFIPVSNTLFDEFLYLNIITDLNFWNKMQVKFLTGHSYFTSTANNLRDVNKEKQIERIKELIVWNTYEEREEFYVEVKAIAEKNKKAKL